MEAAFNVAALGATSTGRAGSGHAEPTDAVEPREVVVFRCRRDRRRFEMFQRSCTPDPSRSGTHTTARGAAIAERASRRLPAAVPPIDGRKQGPHNALTAGAGELAAVATAPRGRDQIEPWTRGARRLRKGRVAARGRLAVALDSAFRRRRYPGVHEHPSGCRARRIDPYAEYAEEVRTSYPLDFSARRGGLWAGLRSFEL